MDETRKKRINLKWFIAIAGAIFIALLVYSSFQQGVVRYEVCVDFHGRSHCAQASGAKPSEAIRSAQEIDCQMIANGRDENVVCLDTQPSSVRAISGN
ncbi:MAG TPA: hypothetical protein VGR72_09165 [Candidatus Acidoferrales bacterium]|nr:hypothetical protein [Candidatus Acidoferrales bacterium]